MNNNLFFELSGIIFTLLLLRIYFSKKRLVSISNNIYISLIFSSAFVILLDTVSILSITKLGTESFLAIILSKLYLISIAIWAFILMIYVFTISFKKIERLPKNEKVSFNSVVKKSIPLAILSVLAILILPIDINYDNNIVYFGDFANYALYIMIIVLTISCIIRYILRFKYIKRVKSNTILFVIIALLLSSVLQIVYPELLILILSINFITFALYFLIDNPDLNLMNELEIAKKEALESEAAKTDALLKASHEIRTPLNAIVGFSQSMLEGSSNNQKEDVMHIKEASEDLLNVVNNILEISNIDMQKYKLVYSDYNVKLLIKQIEGIIKSKIEDKKIELDVNVEDNVPEYLCGDNIRIKQIILNVLYNSIKYTKVGGININVGGITIGNICRLIVTIKDTGIGIYEDKLEKLFEGKIIENKELTEEDINLNLATIKEILKSMNGQITIESEYREGTTVTLVIAQKLGSKEEDENIDVKNEIKDFRGKKVLIVDDDKINLKVATRLLSSYNVDIEESVDGLDCIAKIQNGEKFDLIFLDDWMPNMSGVEALKKLDKIKGFNVPVVALTANATSEMRDKYIKEGFNDYIPKPIERKELDRVIDKYLSNNN